MPAIPATIARTRSPKWISASSFCEMLLRAAAVKQRRERIGIGLENLQQDAVPVAGILLAGAEYIVLLAIVDDIKAGHGLAGSGGAVSGRIGQGGRRSHRSHS